MFITAYGALIFDAQVKAGDFVIIPAATPGELLLIR